MLRNSVLSLYDDRPRFRPEYHVQRSAQPIVHLGHVPQTSAGKRSGTPFFHFSNRKPMFRPTPIVTYTRGLGIFLLHISRCSFGFEPFIAKILTHTSVISISSTHGFKVGDIVNQRVVQISIGLNRCPFGIILLSTINDLVCFPKFTSHFV
jgi:hypothetical protein